MQEYLRGQLDLIQDIKKKVEELLGDDYEPVNTKPNNTTIFKYEE